MEYTEQQKNILASSGNIKINAVAGSGKTATLIEYARHHSPRNRILYLAFNRSVRLEAQRRFRDAGLFNVTVHTAHSLAYRPVVAGNNYRVKQSYRPHEILSILGKNLHARDPHTALLIAAHVIRCAAMFCSHSQERVNDLDYPGSLADISAKKFAQAHLETILRATRIFLAKMNSGEIEVTHEFYLKRFQLDRPELGYDIVLFDEGQDASPVMLDIFIRQPARLVIVGDIHQQIYGWRHAVNALGYVDFAPYPLTTSFRFGAKIANMATECLGWKRHLGTHGPVTITGAGRSRKTRTRSVLARTNLFLLRNAIDTVLSDASIRKIYFEGNLASYTYASEGASIYDVLSLYTGKHDRIRDSAIRNMPDFEFLREYADKAQDMELSLLADIVEEYKWELPRLLKMIRTLHVEDSQRDQADLIFSTVHRCKGMEYDSVELENDFIDEDRLVSQLSRSKEQSLDLARLEEEINLAYVAITRAKRKVECPPQMFPDLVPKPACPSTNTPKKTLPPRQNAQPKKKGQGKSHSRWTKQDDHTLRRLAQEFTSVPVMCTELGRKPGAIYARMKKLGIAWDL